MSSMLRNTNAKQGSKSKAGEYKLDASGERIENFITKIFELNARLDGEFP